MESRDFHFQSHHESNDNALCLPSVISSQTDQIASHHLPLDYALDSWRREMNDWSFGQRPMYPASSSRLGLCQYTAGYLDAQTNGLSLSLFAKPKLKRDREASGISINRNDGVVPPDYGGRSSGPLGPFTGYETILKSSVFLKPARQLLDEFSALSSTERLRNPSEKAREDGEVVIEFAQGPHSDYQRTKGKLLSLHNEVCRMHRQYHHQIQVATSSFAVVAGLENAAPFASLAVNEVSRSFRTMKHAIDNQLKQIRDDHKMEEIRANVHQKSSSSINQQVWRPQRGLPERAVTILRAWLFEHFLHPYAAIFMIYYTHINKYYRYPTDNDKLMLAAQTGLSRNQVSNWFINARVRVWKPMVEEIHMLETKELSESEQSIRVESGVREGSSRPKSDQSLTVNNRLENPRLGFGLTNGERVGIERWRDEYHHDLGFDGSVRFLKSNGNRGTGAVSLTLGLEQGVNRSVYHPQMQGQNGSCNFK